MFRLAFVAIIRWLQHYEDTSSILYVGKW